jgi:hypothetical protein
MLKHRKIPGMPQGTGSKEHGRYKTRNKARYRQARNRSGEGYQTNRTNSRYKFDIIIEHGRFDTSIAEAKYQMQKFMGIIENEFLKKVNVPTFTSGHFKAFGAVRKGTSLKTMASVIQTQLKSKKFTDAIFKDFASDVGRLGVAHIRTGIMEPENAPRSFRYDTGMMYNSVDFRKRQTKDKIIVQVGWIDRFYKYFDFQERGTQHVGAMNAITRGYRKTAPQSYRLLYRFMSNYTEKNGFSGRYTR